ncbi:hypothetical protein D7V88_20200, partial [Corallococcus terminator]
MVAAAFWFHSGALGVVEARRRVLAAWRPGASVWMLSGGYLLRLATPLKVAVESAPGLPLVLESGVLTSAPLTPKDRERLAPPPGAIVLVLAGAARLHVPGEARQLEPGTWLDVSGWQRMAVKGLGAPPLAMQQVLTPLPPPTRESFGPGVPALAPEAERMLARMAGKELPVTRREGLFARLRKAFSARSGQDSEVVTVRREGVFARLRKAFGARSEDPSEVTTARGRGAPGAASGGAMTVRRAGLFARLREALFPDASASGGERAPGSGPGLWQRLFGTGASPEAGLTRAGQGTSSTSPKGPGWFARLLAGMRGSEGAADPHGSRLAAPTPPASSSPLMRALRSWLRAFSGASSETPGTPSEAPG